MQTPAADCGRPSVQAVLPVSRNAVGLCRLENYCVTPGPTQPVVAGDIKNLKRFKAAFQFTLCSRILGKKTHRVDRIWRRKQIISTGSDEKACIVVLSGTAWLRQLKIHRSRTWNELRLSRQIYSREQMMWQTVLRMARRACSCLSVDGVMIQNADHHLALPLSACLSVCTCLALC